MSKFYALTSIHWHLFFFYQRMTLKVTLKVMEFGSHCIFTEGNTRESKQKKRICPNQMRYLRVISIFPFYGLTRKWPWRS
jgi:hypothetical protein